MKTGLKNDEKATELTHLLFSTTANANNSHDSINNSHDTIAPIALPRPAYFESMVALSLANMNINDQIDNFGYFRSSPGQPNRASEEHIVPGERQPLWASIVVSRVNKIDVKDESFEIAFLLQLMWKANLSEVGLSDISEKAQLSGYNFRLSDEEEHRFEKKIPIPTLRIHNSIELIDLEEPVVRVYNGSLDCNYISYTNMYRASIHCVFNLHHFPYDVQKLPMKFMIRQFELWAKYDLTFMSVHYFKHALKMSEWSVCSPTLKRSAPSYATSYVFLTLKRHHAFYEWNVANMMFFLEFLSLVSFFCDPTVAGSVGRVTIVVTLLLTVVATKFTVANMLPSLPYNTWLDEYFMKAAFGLMLMTFVCIIPQLFSNHLHRDTANMIAFGVSFLVIVGGYFHWRHKVFQYRKVEHADYHSITRFSDEKNYYCFRYCALPFLDNSDILREYWRLNPSAEWGENKV